MTVVILISLESPVQVQDQDSQVEGQGQGEQENNLSCRVDLKVHCCAVWLPSTCRMAAPLFLLHLSMVVLSYRSFVIALPFAMVVVIWSYSCDYGCRQYAGGYGCLYLTARLS